MPRIAIASRMFIQGAALAVALGAALPAHAGLNAGKNAAARAAAAAPSADTDNGTARHPAHRGGHNGHGGYGREFDAGALPRIVGATYGEWAARWTAWAEAGAVGQNAVTDDSGQYCAANQPRSEVWFLAGTFGGAVERSCTVPAGRALFYPVLGITWIDCPGTGDEALTDLEVREVLVQSMAEPVELASTLNGTSIVSLRASIVRAQSPVFRSVLPANNVLEGICPAPLPAGRTGRRIVDGYWVMLPPLPAGRYTLTLRGAVPSLPFDSSATYHLHVTGR